MPLPLTVSCFTKIPDKGPLNVCVCVCVCACVRACVQVFSVVMYQLLFKLVYCYILLVAFVLSIDSLLCDMLVTFGFFAG